MTRNTLLIALAAGFFATTGAYAQTSNGNSSGAASMPTAAPMQSADMSDGASAPMKKHHKARKHMNKQSSTGQSADPSKTPAVETGASAATENGQSK
ncbi:hypothetical protein SBC1_29590 [Caballeronia sp. SBC1]|uniref:hypothetical protein n=1 Tax=unclassified Caballeronia TaxID=2646786 RepID=UPI0013E16DB7|nr:MULTISPECIES: hypothetical protein [unclassified Caballeronia]QIE24924.1 hypothetical protein SBC2_29740 [Caballeronia sp. SBC2]QIN62942.1 hypothetical protein SBC1_29590 [Caballeronia sp. SBC1]